MSSVLVLLVACPNGSTMYCTVDPSMKVGDFSKLLQTDYTETYGEHAENLPDPLILQQSMELMLKEPVTKMVDLPGRIQLGHVFKNMDVVTIRADGLKRKRECETPAPKKRPTVRKKRAETPVNVPEVTKESGETPAPKKRVVRKKRVTEVVVASVDENKAQVEEEAEKTEEVVPVAKKKTTKKTAEKTAEKEVAVEKPKTKKTVAKEATVENPKKKTAAKKTKTTAEEPVTGELTSEGTKKRALYTKPTTGASEEKATKKKPKKTTSRKAVVVTQVTRKPTAQDSEDSDDAPLIKAKKPRKIVTKKTAIPVTQPEATTTTTTEEVEASVEIVEKPKEVQQAPAVEPSKEVEAPKEDGTSKEAEPEAEPMDDEMEEETQLMFDEEATQPDPVIGQKKVLTQDDPESFGTSIAEVTQEDSSSDSDSDDDDQEYQNAALSQLSQTVDLNYKKDSSCYLPKESTDKTNQVVATPFMSLGNL